MKLKAFLTIPVAILAGQAFAAIAAAHNATATGTCQTGVTWSATNYDGNVTNSITVTINGTVRYTDPDFKASDSGTIATDKTVPHQWRVVVNAPGTQFDHDLTGSYGACVTPPTTVAATTTLPATTTTVASTTTVPVTTSMPISTVVAVDTPPVPCPYNPTVPAGSPLCVAPTTTAVASDVVVVEPVLPRTGDGDTVFVGACILVAAGFVLLVVRGRRVP